MNLKEVLKLTDELVFASTGKHLNDLQEKILCGTWQHEDYNEIARKVNLSEARVREVGMELWKILSQELGEKVTKSNFKAAMERLQNANLFNFIQTVSHSFNICEKSRHPPDIPNPHSQNEDISDFKSSQTLHHDLSEMPDLGVFYDRTSELETLTNWILEQRCRLITLTGISGIGKTALAAQLVQQIKNELKSVIWLSLESSPTLTELQEQLIQFFSQSEQRDSSATSPKALPLIKYLQKQRCLVILDDVHNLFKSGELAGRYKPEHEEYRTLFKQIETLSHQSCFLLIGWEQPRDIPKAKKQDTQILTLKLTGLDLMTAQEILRNYGLTEIHYWERFIDCYQGNPFWLKSVATQIQELGESVTELLSDDTILLPEDLKDSLQKQCDRISELEYHVLSLLARESEPINLKTLLEKSTIPVSDLLNALQSLSQRCLIEKQGGFYLLPSVLKQYIKLTDIC